MAAVVIVAPMRRNRRVAVTVLLVLTGLAIPRVSAATSEDDSLPGEPRGERIALVDSAGSLAVLESGAPRHFVRGATTGDRPSWSPDGTELVHSRSTPDGGPELFVTRLDGASRQLTSGHAYGIGLPAWSPDGETIAFDDVDQPLLAVPVVAATVSVIRADGTGQRQLTSSLMNAAEPTWSPGGRELAVTGAEASDANLQIVVLDAATGGITRRLTDELLGDDVLPAWSPDGDRVAYNFVPSSDYAHGFRPWQLGVVGADGHDAHVILADPDRYLYAPTWTSDGRIVFGSAPVDGNGAASPTHDALEVVNADGTGRRVIVSDLNSPIPAAAPGPVVDQPSTSVRSGDVIDDGALRIATASAPSSIERQGEPAQPDRPVAAAPVPDGGSVTSGEVVAAPDGPRAPSESRPSTTEGTERFPAAAVAALAALAVGAVSVRRLRARAVATRPRGSHQ